MDEFYQLKLIGFGANQMMFMYRLYNKFLFQSQAPLYVTTCEIIIRKFQGMPQYDNAAHPNHPEKEETSPNRNHIITS